MYPFTGNEHLLGKTGPEKSPLNKDSFHFGEEVLARIGTVTWKYGI